MTRRKWEDGKARVGWRRLWLSGWCVPELSTADNKPSEVGSGWVARSYPLIPHFLSPSTLRWDLSKQQPLWLSPSYSPSFFPSPTTFSTCPFSPSLSLSYRLISGVLSVCRQTVLSVLCVRVLVLTTDNSGYCLSVCLSVYQTQAKRCRSLHHSSARLLCLHRLPLVYIPKYHLSLSLSAQFTLLR